MLSQFVVDFDNIARAVAKNEDELTALFAKMDVCQIEAACKAAPSTKREQVRASATASVRASRLASIQAPVQVAQPANRNAGVLQQAVAQLAPAAQPSLIRCTGITAQNEQCKKMSTTGRCSAKHRQYLDNADDDEQYE